MKISRNEMALFTLYSYADIKIPLSFENNAQDISNHKTFAAA
ncbi:hypothetical protein QQ008_15640 [Fulvivirgaceae bacterium BMA10]|uniref:Uncharacterized protein n=1 Tax=Splendidivirga corallicola TaxID=3051826 RepID=A0ABT8KPZ7_9BACT|nr:hypothetical protein [Fulvivirgaceae bacterium BMA10]